MLVLFTLTPDIMILRAILRHTRPDLNAINVCQKHASNPSSTTSKCNSGKCIWWISSSKYTICILKKCYWCVEWCQDLYKLENYCQISFKYKSALSLPYNSTDVDRSVAIHHKNVECNAPWYVRLNNILVLPLDVQLVINGSYSVMFICAQYCFLWKKNSPHWYIISTMCV